MKARIFILATGMFISLTSSAFTPAVEEGKRIFMTRCAACHNVNKILTGPALAGVHERRSIEWIIQFVTSSQSLVKKGDEQAVALFEKFNKIPMPDHKDLTAENIKNIVEFIKEESGPASSNAVSKSTAKMPTVLPIQISRQPWLFAGLLASVLLLIGSLFFAVWVQNLKNKIASESSI